MKKLELLNIPEDVRNALQKSYLTYLRNAKIKIDILDIQGNVITVRVEQVRKTTDKIFTGKELIERASEVFEVLPEGFQIRYRPLTFKGEGVEAVSADYVRNMMKRHKITQSELCEAMRIDKYAMSKLLSNQYSFTNWHQSAFYYYFKYLATKLDNKNQAE